MLRRITDEMRRYMNSGCCPYCGAAILNGAYNLLKNTLNLSPGGSGLNAFERLRLAPGGAHVTYAQPNTFTCGWCRETWNIREQMTPSQGQALLLRQLNARQNASAIPTARTPGQFRLTGLSRLPRHASDVARIESFPLRNASAATVTGTQGGLNLAGFATLGKTLSNEIVRTYSVGGKTQLSGKQSVSAAVPPYTAVELIMHWRLVQEPGWGLFTGTAGEEIHIPFVVDVELFGSGFTRDI